MRSGRRWRIGLADLDSWVRSRPAGGVVYVAPGRYVSVDRRPHVDLLERSGLSDGEVARTLGVSAARVARWRQAGVPNLYVMRLSRLVEAEGSD